MARSSIGGDIDAQGFQILAQLRAAFPQVESILMDQAILAASQPFIGLGTPSPVEALPQLTLPEQWLFGQLAAQTLRLEQEHISHHCAVAQRQRAMASLL